MRKLHCTTPRHGAAHVSAIADRSKTPTTREAEGSDRQPRVLNTTCYPGETINISGQKDPIRYNAAEDMVEYNAAKDKNGRTSFQQLASDHQSTVMATNASFAVPQRSSMTATSRMTSNLKQSSNKSGPSSTDSTVRRLSRGHQRREERQRRGSHTGHLTSESKRSFASSQYHTMTVPQPTRQTSMQ